VIDTYESYVDFFNVFDVIFTNSNFYVISGDNTSNSILISSTPQLSNWTLLNIAPSTSGEPVFLTYKNNAFIYGTTKGYIAYSSNLTNWSYTQPFTFIYGKWVGATNVEYGNNIYVATGYNTATNRTIQYSLDLSNWLPINTGGFSNYGYTVKYNGSYWIAIGAPNFASNVQSVQISYDGSNWASISLNRFLSGVNSEGYGNAFAVSAYNSNVVGGSVPPSYFTNASDNSNFFNAMSSNSLTGCKAINMNHQTATHLKITTKHYDNTSLIRSDNI
jgi:hypothetical protein